MKTKSSLAMLTANFLLALDAYPYVPNYFRTQIPHWNGFWVLRFGQMINYGVLHNLIDSQYAVPSIPQGEKSFLEDMRTDVLSSLKNGMISTNTLAVAQTALDILNSPANEALGKISFKKVAPLAWYETGSKIVDAQTKTKEFRKSVEKNVRTWYKIYACSKETYVVNEYTTLF